MDEWKSTTLGDFSPFKYGKSLPKSHRNDNGVYPVYGSSGIVGYHDKYLIKGPGIIIGRKGSVGEVHFSHCPFWPIDTTFYIEDSPHRDIRFTYYLLKSIGLNKMNFDSAVPGLNREAAHKRQIKVPPLPEQKAIAHILGTLDDKIELNRRMNETLEEMAKAIFKSWFVDFDPVIDNALQAGNPIPDALAEKAARRRAILEKLEKEDPNLPKLSPEIARLFPDSFDDSPLGPIPKGWRVGSIKDIAILQRKNIKPFEYPEKIFLLYSIPSFDEGKVPKREKGKDIKSNKYLVPHEAVLISKLNPRIPRVWLPCPEEDIHSICSTEFFVLAPSKVSKEYLYCLLNSENFLNVFATLATGTSSSHQRVKPESLLQIELIIPQGDCVKLFTDQVFYIFQQIKQNEKEIQTLGSLRDTLLPKLISGQIRIKDAEKFVGEQWL